jgi:hypothetical protein
MRVTLPVRNTFVAIVFLGLFAMATRNATDPDLWWHLKAGQYIAEHQSIPHNDPFSYTRSGQPWVAHEWLTELLLYETQRHAGWGGLILLFAAVLCAAFYFLYLRCRSGPYVAGIATLAGAWATMPVWGVRPQVISLLLTNLWLLVLERAENNRKLLWWTLPLTLLWVNLHAGFALGLALSALFLAGNLLEILFGYSQKSAPCVRTEALILVLDVLLVPLNPNGIRMFRYPFEVLHSPAMQGYIAEWASPNFHHPEYWPFLFLILAAFATMGRFRGLRPRDLLLLIVSLYAGLSSIRMIPLFAFVAVPLISLRIGNWPSVAAADRRRLQASLHPWFNGIIVVALAVFTAIHAVAVIRFQPEAERQHFPTQAVAYLQQHPAAGRIFNHYDWGGYLIWKLYPTRVFIDGRADLYGEQFLNQFAETYEFQDDWQKPLEQWKISTVVIPPSSALATGLQNATGWAISYEDAQAIILTSRRGP